MAEHAERQLKARASAVGSLALRKSHSGGRRVSGMSTLLSAASAKQSSRPTMKFCAEEARMEELLYEVLRHITFSHDAMR